MRVNEALFSTSYIPPSKEPIVTFQGVEPRTKAPDEGHYNTDPRRDPCEAVIALSIGQSVTPRGEIEVKHFKESTYGTVSPMHVSAENVEALRARLHAMVDSMIGSYYDFTNGV